MLQCGVAQRRANLAAGVKGRVKLGGVGGGEGVDALVAQPQVAGGRLGRLLGAYSRECEGNAQLGLGMGMCLCGRALVALRQLMPRGRYGAGFWGSMRWVWALG
jgi:hypothetical protein